MEWVETTGKTVEEALDAALDQLGVHEDEAEYEVLEEPKVGLFGRMRGDARIRARVRPTKPRAKEDRRDRRRRTPKASETADVTTEPVRRRPQGGDRREEDTMSETGVDVPLTEQADVAAAFLKGVVDQFGLTATLSIRDVDDDTVEVAVEGDDLGLLIGPKGATLTALQDLARTVVQRKTSARNGRLLVDVAGYRKRRKEALERFAKQAADQVIATRARVVLEPMSPADRKVVHDTVNEIAGVSTMSQGEEPRRRVVLLPDES